MTELQRVTSLDVARKAGVSQPTVSRVFTPGASVSEKLSRRVKAAAQELGYLPNTVARSLTTGKSRVVGLIVAYMNNQFYPQALEKLSLALRAKGYQLMVFFAANQAEEVEPVIEELIAHQVDGIILASVSTSNALTLRLAALGIPFVLFNRGQENDAVASVTSANFEGGRTAALFLAGGGHKRIAHISGWQKSLNGRHRQQGFVAGLAECGQAPLALIDSKYSRDLARQATIHLMKATVKPDAIFVGNDHMAFAVIETLRHELGLRVPQDVSIVGYDDVEMAAWSSYDLTTLRQPANRMVETTVEVLIELIDNPDAPRRQIEIESPLILRGSARIPAGYERGNDDHAPQGEPDNNDTIADG